MRRKIQKMNTKQKKWKKNIEFFMENIFLTNERWMKHVKSVFLIHCKIKFSEPESLKM